MKYTRKHENNRRLNRFLKILLTAAGSVSVFLGVLGIFLPLLPTTPLLLLGAACYSRSSEKLNEKLLSNRLLGSYIRNYRKGNGIPLRTKIFIIALLWLSIGYSAVFAVPVLWVRAVLFFIAVGVTVHILHINTLEEA